MLDVQLHRRVEGVVVRRGRLPGEAVGVVSRCVLGKTERVGPGLLEQRVRRGVVVGVVDAREYDLGEVAAEVFTEVDVSTVVPAHTAAL